MLIQRPTIQHWENSIPLKYIFSRGLLIPSGGKKVYFLYKAWTCWYIIIHSIKWRVFEQCREKAFIVIQPWILRTFHFFLQQPYSVNKRQMLLVTGLKKIKSSELLALDVPWVSALSYSSLNELIHHWVYKLKQKQRDFFSFFLSFSKAGAPKRNTLQSGLFTDFSCIEWIFCRINACH